MIELKNLTKTYPGKNGPVTALQDVSLTIEDGDIYGIIGFSGAGKSTLVRCINQLEIPDLGQVLVDGQDMTSLKGKELRAARRKIGMIFQNFNLMPSRTIAQNVAYPLRHAPLSREEKKKKVESLLKLVGLEDKADSRPHQLSGGQKQRAAIARALACDPRILLCDEATSALDPVTTRSILKLLKKVNETLGITLVVITHQMEVVKEICCHAAVMENGVCLEQGRTFDIFAKPQHSLTQKLLQSATRLSRVQEVLQDSPYPAVSEKGKLVRLTFQEESTVRPLLWELSRKFNLMVNILFADIEYVQGSPVGGSVVVLEGEPGQIEAGLSHLKNSRIRVEELACE